LNKEFQKKLNELSKLSGYEKPKKISGSLKLDSNENFVIGKQFQSDLINAAKKRCDIREYPLGGTEKLVVKLSEYLKVPSNMVGVGNGSDQILDLFLANFCTRKTRILTSEPTFAFFEERCKLYGVKMIKVPFSDGMTLDVDQFLSKSKNADLIYIDSPNNPTGGVVDKNQIKKIIQIASSWPNCAIISDEIYDEINFLGNHYSVAALSENVPVITLYGVSKIYYVSGWRIGYIAFNSSPQLDSIREHLPK